MSKTDLTTLPTEDLQAELARRGQAVDPMPLPLEVPNWEPVRRMIEGAMVDAYASKEPPDDDLPHYVYEEAMTAVYGPDFWPWYNRQGWAQ